MALSLLALSKGQTSGSKLAGPFLRSDLWLLAGWLFLKARLVAPNRLALSKGHTCVALSLLVLSKGQASGSKTASPFLRLDLWLTTG